MNLLGFSRFSFRFPLKIFTKKKLRKSRKYRMPRTLHSLTEFVEIIHYTHKIPAIVLAFEIEINFFHFY